MNWSIALKDKYLAWRQNEPLLMEKLAENKSFPKGAHIIKEGTSDPHFYFVEKGFVRGFYTDHWGNENTLFLPEEGPFLGAYIHAGNKIAAITALSAKVENGAEIARNISMQVASMAPETLSYKDFTPEYLAQETDARIAAIEKDNEELARLNKPLKNIPKYVSYAQITEEVLKQAEEDAKAELKAEGKPEQIWDKIIPGKIQRFFIKKSKIKNMIYFIFVCIFVPLIIKFL